MATIKETLTTATISLSSLYEKQHSKTVALWLLKKVTGKQSAHLLSHGDEFVSEEQLITLRKYVTQLTSDNYPLQYILGSVSFGPLEIICEPPVLIPRPETEQWVEKLITKLTAFKDLPLTILDMCTGSGCIGLALAHGFKNSTVHAVDNAPHALALAQKNAAHNTIKNFVVHNSDGFTNLNPSLEFDLIVSNPPYITDSEFKTLEPVVTQWEDKHALVAADEGLALYKQFAHDAPVRLKKQSPIATRFVVEIGSNQGQSVSSLFAVAGFSNVTVKQDNNQKDRTVWAEISKNLP